MENNTEKPSHAHQYWCCYGGGRGFGLFLLALGIFWFAKEANWIPGDFSFWPVLLGALGVYLLFRGKRFIRY